MTRWLSDDEQAVWRAFLTVHSELDARLGRNLQASGELSLPEFAVLVHLSESPDEQLRVQALADVLQWQKSRLSHQLTRMERRGLIVRQACPQDRRGSFAVLTDAGREVLNKVAPDHVEQVRRIVFDALTPAQVRALGSACNAVLEGLAEDDAAADERASQAG